MNRLREGSGDDQVVARGIALLRETPPAPTMDQLKRQVWQALQQTNDPAWGRYRVPTTAPTRIRTFVLVVVFSVVAGSAGAMVLGRWISSHQQEATPLPVRDAKTGAGAVRQRPTTSRRLQPPPSIGDSEFPAAPPVETPQADVPPAQTSVPAPRGAAPRPAESGSVATSGKMRRAARPVAATELSQSSQPVPATAPVPVPGAGPAGQAERTEVLDAMVALRRHHDPVLAGVLLDRYLAGHPQGALREEALALAIEAAASRGDRASSRTLARTYQASYPRGRFLAFARSQVD